MTTLPKKYTGCIPSLRRGATTAANVPPRMLDNVYLPASTGGGAAMTRSPGRRDEQRTAVRRTKSSEAAPDGSGGSGSSGAGAGA